LIPTFTEFGTGPGVATHVVDVSGLAVDKRGSDWPKISAT